MSDDLVISGGGSVAVATDEQFADAWKTCVYRVVQEALHNCEKHASPSRQSDEWM